MQRLGVFVYGVAAYGLFLGTILYAIGFVGNWWVPYSIDGVRHGWGGVFASGQAAPLVEAIAVNGLLLLAFAVQHTIMARPAFKAWITRFIPSAAERSTFVVIASALLAVTMWQWRPLGEVVWQVHAGWGRAALIALSLLGWALVFYSTFIIDHFDLFGLRQVWLYVRGKPYTHHAFAERSVYRYIRHPLMLGFLIAFWATPVMTAGHLFFAGLITAYVLAGIRFEERDLVRQLGTAYVAYRARTPMLIPFTRQRRGDIANTGRTAVPPARPSSRGKQLATRMGAASVLFFFVKGVAWLTVPLLAAQGCGR